MSEALAPAGAKGAEVWPDSAARFYAEALDGSDYGAAATGALAGAFGAAPESLLDVGAGAGHPVCGWVAPAARWTALEPSRYLRARLGRLRRTSHPGLRPLDARWQDLPRLGLAPHEIAFAANIGAPLQAPAALLGLMRARARRAVVWIVPAQRGPRRWCLAGALPAVLHGEEERPGLELVLKALGPAHRPDRMALFPWAFTARFRDRTAAFDHCAAQLRLGPADPRRAALATHLDGALRPASGGGVALSAPKLSGLLVWDLT